MDALCELSVLLPGILCASIRIAMKKPVQRVSLLEDVLSDFMEVEDILLKLELKEKLQPLTANQRQLYKEIMERLRELLRDLAKEVTQEHRAA